MVEEIFRVYIPCHATTPIPIQHELLLPNTFCSISLDLSETFSSGDYVLMIIDEYSRFPEIQIIPSTLANRLNTIFARLGLPTVVKTDNGRAI